MAVVPFPGRPAREASRLPSRRSLLAGAVLFALGIAVALAARSTGLFAVRTVEVRGADSTVAREVRRTLSDVVGETLLSVRPRQIERRVEALPGVAGASVDRAFPRALVVVVRSERAVAVIRQGQDSWLVSARGRIIRELPRGARAELPRLWLSRAVPLSGGGTVREAETARAVRALGVGGAPSRVRTVRAGRDDLTYVLASGLELRLGDTAQLRLKLAVGRHLLPLLGEDAAYLDVSVPVRPVEGTTLNSQVEVES